MGSRLASTCTATSGVGTASTSTLRASPVKARTSNSTFTATIRAIGNFASTRTRDEPDAEPDTELRHASLGSLGYRALRVTLARLSGAAALDRERSRLRARR